MVSSLLALALAAAIDAPVTAVTVYSDRARVTRTAQVSAHGEQVVQLPLLQGSIEPASIRLTATGAEVRRVEIARIQADDFPADKVKKLLDALDALDDQIQLVQGDKGSQQAVLEVIDRIHPSLPQTETQRPLPKLSSTGWSASQAFESNWRDKLQSHIRDDDAKIEDLGRQRAKLQAEAQKLNAARRGGYRVSAHIAGNGQARLELSYLVASARWYPVYDLTLDPNRSRVQVAFAALVSQESGEDWNSARLTVSTAVPATATELPKLLTWKIGEKERFIPTPSPAVENVPPPPQAVPPLALANLDEQLLRQRLSARLNGQSFGLLGGRGGNGIGAAGYDERPDQLPKPMPSRRAMSMAPPPPPAAEPAPEREEAMAPPEMNAPAAPRPTVDFDEAEVTGSTVAATPPTSRFGLAPPPGYVAPAFAPNTPVALAGGYDLAFRAVQPESVPSGGGAKRVALFATSWPVTVERKLFPALAPEAFLVAELKNPQSTALPGGEADLFVGQDPAGTAHLDFVAPGEEFTLPLGLDRALKPVRNVKLVEGEKGVFSKDQVNTYEVTTELANPYGVPIAVKLFDQWPVTSDEHVEVKLLSSDPFAKQDPVKGSLEWDLTVAPHHKATVRFSYSIRTPSDYRLHQ